MTGKTTLKKWPLVCFVHIYVDVRDIEFANHDTTLTYPGSAAETVLGEFVSYDCKFI